MQIIFTFSVGALLLASEAVAAATTKSLVTCITKNGPKPVATVKTVSRVLTVPFYGFKFTTTTPTRVITPSPTTITITATATSVTTETLTQETDTFSETVTSTDKILTTSTGLSTVTNFDTVIVTLSPTTTLAAPAGFQPVRSSFPNSVKRRSASQPEDASRESALEERAQGQARIFFRNGKAECSPKVYPTAVTCAGIAKVISTSTITRTAKTKTITGTKPTSSVTTTTTSVSTTTLTPVRASSTLCFTTSTSIIQTQIQSSTITTVSTQTVEVVQPTSTYFAACSPDNIISKVNGQSITQVDYSGFTLQSGNALSSYECCTSCIGTSGCIGTVFDSIYGDCYMLMQSSSVCSTNAQGGKFWVTEGEFEGFILSNGLCGRYHM